MTGKSRKNRTTHPGRQAINRHLYHHHGKVVGSGTLEDRLRMHDDLHWEARRQAEGTVAHTHLPYQEGESDNAMACRLLQEGIDASGIKAEVPDLNREPQE